MTVQLIVPAGLVGTTYGAGTDVEPDGTILLERLQGMIDLGNGAFPDLGWSIAQHYQHIRTQLKDSRLLALARRLRLE